VIREWTADRSFYLGDVQQQIVPVHDRTIVQIEAGEVICESESRNAVLIKGRWLIQDDESWKGFCSVTATYQEDVLGNIKYTGGGGGGYTPDDPTQWTSPPPTTTSEALDRLVEFINDHVGGPAKP